MSTVRKCKQCGNEFDGVTNSKYCSSCSQEVAILHYKVIDNGKIGAAGRGRGFRPRYGDRIKYGFILMGIDNDEQAISE
jgi:hypothetical protein